MNSGHELGMFHIASTRSGRLARTEMVSATWTSCPVLPAQVRRLLGQLGPPQLAGTSTGVRSVVTAAELFTWRPGQQDACRSVRMPYACADRRPIDVPVLACRAARVPMRGPTCGYTRSGGPVYSRVWAPLSSSPGLVG